MYILMAVNIMLDNGTIVDEPTIDIVIIIIIISLILNRFISH